MGADGHEDQEWLTTGDMARLSQTTLRTVRFYEAEGLIESMARAGGSHRKFPFSQLRKLQIISDLREAGLSLAEIKLLMSTKDGAASAASAASQLTAALCERIELLQRRIETLRRVREELLSTVATLRVCRDCDTPGFPEHCKDCHVLDEAAPSRSTDLLWKN